MATRELLAALGDTLDGIAARARTARSELDGVAGAAEAAAERTSSRLGAAEQSLGGFASRAAEASQRIEASAAAAEESIERRAGGMASLMTESAAAVEAAGERIESALEALDGPATKLDDLDERVRSVENAWSVAIAAQIELIKLGAVRIEDFLTKWGQAVVATEDGNKRILELLEGMDFGTYVDRIRGFTEAIKQGRADLEDVLRLLAEQENEIAKQFQSILDLYAQGKVTIERVSEVAEYLKERFKGTEFEELVDAIEEALRNGSLG